MTVTDPDARSGTENGPNSNPVAGSPPPLADQVDRDVITGALDRSLFVEAGAGSGKTTSLVQRIVNLVAVDKIPVNRIAAITFTEAAARELRTRVRDALERRAVDSQNESLDLAAAQVESAAFSTLHSFALRILSDHPIEAGLPPGFGVVDEITSTLEFDESWRLFVGQVGDDLTLLELQERAAALEIDLNRFAGVAKRFDDNWDLLDKVPPDPPTLSEIVFDDLVAGLDDLRVLTGSCAVEGDLYLEQLRTYIDQVEAMVCRDPLDQIQAYRQLRVPMKSRGKAASWREPGLDQVKAATSAYHKGLLERIDQYRNEVMEFFITLVAGFVSDRVAQRQARGELAFHDLLVLARRLLRQDETVRRTLHQRYSRLLLDEFQDTDPIQIELAVLVASADEVGDRPWEELAAGLEPGRLVVVGDPKQSIYRFRRADIEVYTETERVLSDGVCRLTTNFRSVPGVLDWVNRVFERAIGDGEPGRQPPYVALDAARAPSPEDRLPVTLLGHGHDSSTRIQQIRELEGLDVAAVACRIMEEGWLVERAGGWLPARLTDIAVLIPSRLSLPALEAAFAAANVPFRPETNSLVYATQEVRDVLAGVRAVVNPTNSIDVVATLRSGLFAVGDDDLLSWKLAGGSWDYREDPPTGDLAGRPADEFDPTSVPADGAGAGGLGSVDPAGPADPIGGSVAEAFAVLRRWHADRWWHDPANLIDRIVRERRLRESALAEPRPRDRWRRYRFLAEQARQFSETQGGDLHDFVDWVEVQASDLARVTEPIPAEPDDDAVRVLTIHGAKGLEFPIVILAGAPTEEGRGRVGPQVIFPRGGRPEVRLAADRQTADFDVHASLEEVLDSYERIRLHYVAATRAKDHLVVSAHHKEGKRQSIGKRTWEASADHPELWTSFERRGDEHYAATPPTQLRLAGGDFEADLTRWQSLQDQIVADVQLARHRSATTVAEEAARVTVAEEAARETGDGSGLGSSFGTAVHSVLERIDFDRPDDLMALATSCAADEGVSDMADEVADRVRAALACETIELARNNPHHRELYVAAPAGNGTVEGFVDLCIEVDGGLMVVDYKTDRLVGDDALDAKVDRYRLQAATYAVALEAITDRPVVGCRFLFLAGDEVIETDVADLDEAKGEARQLLAMSDPAD